MGVVRRVRADEWEALRDVRLRALAESPQAFGSTFEGESAFQEAVWKERAEAGSLGEDRATFVAQDDTGRLVGLATGLVEDDAAGQGHLVSMWVDPAHRKRGLGAELVEAVAAWATARGLRTLMLWVVRENLPAVALYLDRGFEAAGPEQPLPHTPALTEVLMFRRLDGA